jgi:hypothetical protein
MIRNAGFNTECLQERSVLSSLDPSVLELVDFYWAQFFGCVPEALRADTPQIVASSGPGAYAGCHLMEFGGAPVVSLPVEELESNGHRAMARWRFTTPWACRGSFWATSRRESRPSLHWLHRSKTLSTC